MVLSVKKSENKSSQDRTRIRLGLDFLHPAMSEYGSSWVGMVIGFPKVIFNSAGIHYKNKNVIPYAQAGVGTHFARDFHRDSFSGYPPPALPLMFAKQEKARCSKISIQMKFHYQYLINCFNLFLIIYWTSLVTLRFWTKHNWKGTINVNNVL